MLEYDLNHLILSATGKSFDDVGLVLMEYDGRGETVGMAPTIHQTPSLLHKKDLYFLYEIWKRKYEDKVDQSEIVVESELIEIHHTSFNLELYLIGL